MSYNIGDKVCFKNISGFSYAWTPEENVIHIVSNKAFDRNEPDMMLYSLDYGYHNSICWIREEDLFDIKTLRKQKLNKINGN